MRLEDLIARAAIPASLAEAAVAAPARTTRRRACGGDPSGAEAGRR